MLFDVVERTVLDAGGVTDDDAQWQRRKRWLSGEDEEEDEEEEEPFDPEYAKEIMELLLRGASASALSERIVALDGGDGGDGGDGRRRA